MDLIPRLDYVVVEIEEEKEEVTKSGLLIVKGNSNENRQQIGKVAGVGEGRILENGTYMPINLKIGDKVIFNKYAGVEIKTDDKTFVILHDRDVLAVIR